TTVRWMAGREAARARLEPQLEQARLAATGAGRRVGRRSDGARRRRRQPQRGPQTTPRRRRRPGAGHAPHAWILYVVDAAGKREASVAPVIAATLQGPEAVVALLRPDVQRLESPQADQGRFLADGAPWRWQRVPLLGQALGLPAERVPARRDW